MVSCVVLYYEGGDVKTDPTTDPGARRAADLRAMPAALFAALAVGVAGCTSQIGHFNLLMAENVNGMPQPIRRGVSGQDCQLEWSLDLRPKLEKAIAKAIGKTGDGNALTNVAVYESRYTYVLVNQSCIRVEGDLVRIDAVTGQ